MIRVGKMRFSTLAYGLEQEGPTLHQVSPTYLPNNIRYMDGSYKVMCMLFIVKAVLRQVEGAITEGPPIVG
jgi:hypothetical protein